MNETVSEDKQRQLAEAVREACLRAALEGYEEAGLSGLCDEGRWEMAIDRIRSLDLDMIIHIPKPDTAHHGPENRTRINTDKHG